jgi:hypothetical protein
LIQSHHEVPGDDDSLIALCAGCHSKRHPDIPRALFFNKRLQPYWHNTSASSLAKEWGVCSRTVIRAARRLNISPGELATEDEDILRNHFHVINTSQLQKGEVLTTMAAAKCLGIHYTTLYRYIKADKVAYVEFGGFLFIPTVEVKRLARVWAKRKRRNRTAGVISTG